jgi:MipA family protein
MRLSTMPRSGFRRQPARLFGVLTLLTCLAMNDALADDSSTENADPSQLIGAGIQRLPGWVGSHDDRNQPIPFLQLTLPEHITISSTDGLTVDLIHGSQWHGGLYGDFSWGRDSDDLSAPLRGVIHGFANRPNAGGYVEYQMTPVFDVGSNLSHDTDGAGAYLHVYAEYDLPRIGYIEHSFQWQWQAMNGAAMRRFFGVTPEQASRLDIPTSQPNASGELASLEYDAFIPTSQRTGIALAINYGHLLAAAKNSSLVTRFGTPDQLTTSLAFVYRFNGTP